MRCPFCGHTEDRVVDSRVGRDGEFIRRRRECLKCHRRYTTYEYIEDVLPHVVKRDGRREPFDRQKLRGSILKACEKRSVGVQAVDDVVVEIEAQLHERAEKEITSEELGKPAGRDAVLAKSTYVKLLGIEGAKAEAQRLAQRAMRHLESAGVPSPALRALAGYIVTRNN